MAEGEGVREGRRAEGEGRRAESERAEWGVRAWG